MKLFKPSKLARASNGYSLVEVLTVVVILGVLSSISIAYISEIWKGQIAIANLENMRAWIESVRRSSLRGQPCQVNISIDNLRDGSTVMSSEIYNAQTIQATPCGSPASVELDSTYDKEFYKLSVKSGASDISSFVITPRGTLFNSSSSPSFQDDIVFNLAIANSGYYAISKSYCLRMSGFLGTIKAIGSSAC